jgi:hypothetical protein
MHCGVCCKPASPLVRSHTHAHARMHAHKLRTLRSSKLIRLETCQDYWRIETKPLYTHRPKASPQGLTENTLFHTHTRARTHARTTVIRNLCTVQARARARARTHYSDTKPVYCTYTHTHTQTQL